MTKKRVLTGLVAVLCLCSILTACVKQPAAGENNGTATYSEDVALGEGAKTLTIKVVDNEEKEITFTIHTDAQTVGEAMMEHNLLSGEAGKYGLYIKVVNGVRADYDADGAYWGFFRGGEYMMTGVDKTTVSDGDAYELVYTKG